MAHSKKTSTPQHLSDSALDKVSGGIEVHTVRVITQNDVIGTPDYTLDSAAIAPSSYKTTK